jgi:trk system potassium uptake protein TrkA
VVAVNKNGKMIIVPSAEDVVNENDILVAIGTNEQIEHFQNSLGEE